MRSIRRLYFYLVAFISLEVMLWGVIGLARSIFNGDAIIFGETLAGALALLLVGIPIFLIHWLWAQKTASGDPEEQTASLRALFFYAALLATLVPVVQNLLALINWLLLQGAHLDRSFALLGGNQSLTDNLIAIFANLLVGAYFWLLLRAEWPRLPERQNFAEVRRLYRYFWLLYSLLMTLWGVEQILLYLFTQILSNGLGADSQVVLNALALTLVGMPLWAYTWRLCQTALTDKLEQGSTLRLGALYLFTIAGLTVMLTTTGVILYQLLQAALSGNLALAALFDQIKLPLSLAIPFGAIWAYYGDWFQRESASAAWDAQRIGIRRLYFYPLAAAGLVLTVTGIAMLLSFLIDLVVTRALWGDTLSQRLAATLADLAVGLPLWLMSWRPMQAEALAQGAGGDSARQSVVRRFYLYAVIFVAVIGGMITAGMLAFSLLLAVLTLDIPSTFLSDLLNQAQVFALFALVLVYHILNLRQDSRRAEQLLAQKRRQFDILALETEESAFGARLASALKRQSDNLKVTLLAAGAPLPEDAAPFAAIALPAGLALNPPPVLKTWLEGYSGLRVLIPLPESTWLWAGDFPKRPEERAAKLLRQLADGETPRPAMSGTSAWTVTAYIFSALFGLQLLFGILALIISLLTSF